jgi:hypothetical protein
MEFTNLETKAIYQLFMFLCDISIYVFIFILKTKKKVLLGGRFFSISLCLPLDHVSMALICLPLLSNKNAAGI